MPTPEVYKVLCECSPVKRMGKCAPVLLQLGDGDRRVPHSQGLRWAESLRSAGNDVLVLLFPGNGHALDGFEAERYSFESAAGFLISKLAL